MTLSVRSPEDVVNLALVRIGYPMRVSNMFEGSKAANAALDVYAQTRDELLRQNDWGFAQRDIMLTLLKQAPLSGYIPPNTWSTAYPPLPWLFEYGYPQDCLKVRAVKPSPLFVPSFDPQPNIYALSNDVTFNTASKVILCNVPDAVLVYTGQITDPLTWEADFVEGVAAALARRLAATLASLDVEKIEVGDEAQAKAIAEMEQG